MTLTLIQTFFLFFSNKLRILSLYRNITNLETFEGYEKFIIIYKLEYEQYQDPLRYFEQWNKFHKQ